MKAFLILLTVLFAVPARAAVLIDAQKVENIGVFDDWTAYVFKNGKEKAIKALVGNVMKNSRGKADAVAAEAKIKDIINNA